MVINRCPELAELIPSIGARIALQNYFSKNDSDKEIEISSELSMTSVSTPSVTPTLTLALTPQEIFNATMTFDEKPIQSDIEASIENIRQPLLVKACPDNDTQNIVILSSSPDNEPAKKIQGIETVDNMVT